jgi:hypothetical protein
MLKGMVLSSSFFDNFRVEFTDVCQLCNFRLLLSNGFQISSIHGALFACHFFLILEVLLFTQAYNIKPKTHSTAHESMVPNDAFLIAASHMS